MVLWSAPSPADLGRCIWSDRADGFLTRGNESAGGSEGRRVEESGDWLLLPSSDEKSPNGRLGEVGGVGVVPLRQ